MPPQSELVIRAPASRPADALLRLCGPLGAALCAVDRLRRPDATDRICARLEALGYPSGDILRQIWFGRTVREVGGALANLGARRCLAHRLRIQGNLSVLERPAVFATYHSDWWRFVGPRIPPALRLAAAGPEKWRMRLPGVEVIRPERSARTLLRHLEAGGSCVLTVDHFGGGHAARQCRILDCRVRVPTAAARLPARARVPLVPLALEWSSGLLYVTVGDAAGPGGDPGRVTERVFGQLARAIRRDPASWAQLHRFLRRPPSPAASRVPAELDRPA